MPDQLKEELMREYIARQFIIVMTVAYLLLVIPFHLKPDNFIVDDGYFYLQVARHIASGHGSTFNGVMPTNGYHPLWMLVCVCAAYLTKASSPLIQVAATISDALVLLSIYLFLYICEVAKRKGAIAGIAVIVFMTTTIGIWKMLEADLSLSLQLVILALLVRWRSRKQALTAMHALLIGCLLGLSVLARLDLIFFAFIVYMYIVFVPSEAAGDRPRYLRAMRALFAGASCCFLVCPYLYWNYHIYGHIVPISGAIKSHFLLSGIHLSSYCVPVVIASLLNVAHFAKRRGTPFGEIVLIASGSALLHLTYCMLFGNVAAWYLTTGYLSVAFCLTWLFDIRLERSLTPSREVIWFGLAAFLALLSYGGLRLVSNFTYTRLIHGNVAFRSNYIEPKRAMAERLRQLLPEGSRIYIYDGPGGVAYYSRMSIIPTDGLMGDYSYSTRLLADGVNKYMESEGIDYIIVPRLRQGQIYVSADLNESRMVGGQLVEVFAPLHHRSAGSFVIRDEDMLASFATIVPDVESTVPEVGLWRIRH
jgi:hypothetical protein